MIFRLWHHFEDFEARWVRGFDVKIWKEGCNISCEECDEEDFHDYVPGGDGELDIIYDERNG